MQSYQVPGVWIEERFQTRPRPFLTGVPVFVGLVRQQALIDLSREIRDRKLVRLNIPGSNLQVLRKPEAEEPPSDTAPEPFGSWPEFEENYGFLSAYGYLAAAVRGFFENNGSLCYIQIIYYDDTVSIKSALNAGLSTLRHFDEADLICTPDIMHAAAQSGGPVSAGDVREMQGDILDHCDHMRDRFAILDSLKGADENGVIAHQRPWLNSPNGALYFPWIQTIQGGTIPTCGHVAGVYARSDRRIGVHKAPANEILEGVLDLEFNVDNAVQAELNPKGINCLRAFPGRGIRVWGARLVHDDSQWTYVNVRRLFITVTRWAVRFMTPVVYEPHNSALWARITRELTSYLTELYRRGGFQGATAQEAFFVKCDADNNPQEVRDAGMVIADIGLAVAAPGEFIVVRITHGTEGADVAVSPLQTVKPLAAAPRAAAPVFRRALRADVRITHLEFNPPGPDVPGEYVHIQNHDPVSAELTGWTLSDAAYHTYRFPSFVLNPRAFVRVWTKQGINTVTDLYWGRRAAIWNNLGDKAFLRDSRGLLVFEFPTTA